MGGHGGLNILPQKRWNVYRFDNIEKVRKDEEAAAKEEQLKREQSRKRDTEFRLEKLRVARGLPTAAAVAAVVDAAVADVPTTTEASSSTASKPKSKHINLFEGLKVFPFLGDVEGGNKGDQNEEGGSKKKRQKKEEAPKVISAEDEKYRLGYGLAGKGVKAPWYLISKSSNAESDEDVPSESSKQLGGKNSGKKTLEELREERLKRERREKERERALLLEKNKQRYGAPSKARGFFSR